MDRNLIRTLCAALLIALSLAALVAIRPVYAAGYVVNSLLDTVANDGNCTLREAILAANNAPANTNCGAGSAGNDTITFSVSGVIVLGSTLPNIVSGQGTLTIDGTGQSITISGDNNVQVMVVNGGANLTLQNLSVANGKYSIGLGGGILNYGTLTVVGSTFSNNDAYYGGGIYNYGTVSVTNSTFSGNNSLYGGGIRNAGTLTVTNSTFSGNSADYGGGIYSYTTAGGTLTVVGSTFSGNSANNYGGGIHNNNTLTVVGSTFSGNSANSGGGIYNATSGTLTVTNSTFSGNSATHFNGGGILNGGTLTVTNSTFSDNSANTGGGGIYSFGTATLKNTLIANSPSGGDCVGTLSGSNINNLIEDSSNACGLSHGSNGNIVGVDPNLGALIGSPAYFPLNAGSPAIDAGDNATCAAAPVNNQSQNGVTRPQDGDENGSAICDIGSYEKRLGSGSTCPWSDGDGLG